jgi:RHS repeat-associated protein
VNGDGLDDIVMSLQNVADGTQDDWYVALNHGFFGFQSFENWATLPHQPSHNSSTCNNGTCEEKWTITPVDINQDGNVDLFLTTPDPSTESPQWSNLVYLESHPEATLGERFVFKETVVPQVDGLDYGPVHGAYPPFQERQFSRLGDVNGDGIADLIQCTNPTYDWQPYSRSNGDPMWTVHLWSPTLPGGPGFDPQGTPIPGTSSVLCGAGPKFVYVVDIDGAAGAEILMPIAATGYQAFRFNAATQAFDTISTGLPLKGDLPGIAAPLHFLDVNGDGLSDALYSGLGMTCSTIVSSDCFYSPTALSSGFPGDVPVVAMNTGTTFGTATGVIPSSLPNTPVDHLGTDFYAPSGLSMDVNGDGRMDFLMPVVGHCHPNTDPVAACWVAFISSPSAKGYFDGGPLTPKSAVDPTGYMTPYDLNVPAPADIEVDSASLGSWTIPQVTDVQGNGQQALVYGILDANGNAASFSVLQSVAGQDQLWSIADGLNPLDPSAPGFVPTVTIRYGGLIDKGRLTPSVPEDSPPNDAALYLSRFDATNDCEYPRSCVVGPDQVVVSYILNDGQNQPRNFTVQYRDGRYHRLGRGFLGFGERIILDNDRNAGTAEFYDNATFDPGLQVFPYAEHVDNSWAWAPAATMQPTATQVDLHYDQTTLQELTRTPGTYFVMPLVVETTHVQGLFTDNGQESLFRYVEAAEQTPPLVLSDVKRTVSEVDNFGTVTYEFTIAYGVDDTDSISRSNVTNDEASWLIGLVRDEQSCSAALSMKQCRTTHRDFDSRGDLKTQQVGDPTDPGTQLTTTLEYDTWGHVVHASALDAFGHLREVCASYEPTQVFPFAVRNSLGHTVIGTFDAGFGVPDTTVDPNGLATRWAHDGFGRTVQEIRPDNTVTSYSYGRVSSGGPPGANWYATVTNRADEAGAQISTTFDALLRPVDVTKRLSAVKTCGVSWPCASGLQTTETYQYDHYGRLIFASVPWLTGDPGDGTVYDTYSYDNLGRLSSRTEPWGRTTTFWYSDNVAYASDWLGTTRAEVDALGRVVAAEDKLGNITTTTYGPFSLPWESTRVFPVGPDESTGFTRDAFGRITTELDPDRGTTITQYDGFGEVIGQQDSIARSYEFEYDAIGRLVERADTYPGTPTTVYTAVTRWVYDTAPHGIGLLAEVVNPAGHTDTFSYNSFSRRQSHTLTFADTGESFKSSVDYDKLGRLWHVSYPAPKGEPPLVVQRSYDAFSNLIDVRQEGATTPYWTLQEMDGAGRATIEQLGANVTSYRSYSEASGLVYTIASSTTTGGAAPIPLQSLTYQYDQGLRMTSRRDDLQGTPAATVFENFQHDAINRLTCASFGPTSGLSSTGGQTPPCADPIVYAANGNILSKPGVGTYTYDTIQVHAVTSVTSTSGSWTFGYNGVGNQVSRPGSPNITYTPFDLPARFGGSGESYVDLDYDGDQHRIRKRTDSKTTIYLDDIFERVSSAGADIYKFYVGAGHSTAVIEWTPGAPATTAYVLKDALGSSDVITDETGKVLERRSYDAFGAQRNPTWGSGAPVPSNVVTPLGFTGQEGDDELALVNMRGRIYDPSFGRFLSTDPVVHDRHASQTWNPYSYVWNSPLMFTDPSGFDPSGTGEINGEPANIGLSVTPRQPAASDQNSSAGGATPPPSSRAATQSAGQDDSPNVAPKPARAARVSDSAPPGSLERATNDEKDAAAWAGVWNGLIDQPLDLWVASADPIARALVRPRLEVLRANEPPPPLPHDDFHGVQVREEYDFTHRGITFLTTALGIVIPGVAAEKVAATGATAAEGAETFAAHAAMRSELGLASGEGTLARLEAGGREFWGINAHGQSVAPLRVNAISATHAETDAFAQAARAGVNGGSARLVVDRALCPACGTFGGVRSLARQLGFESLEVVTPAGTSTITP